MFSYTWPLCLLHWWWRQWCFAKTLAIALWLSRSSQSKSIPRRPKCSNYSIWSNLSPTICISLCDNSRLNPLAMALNLQTPRPLKDRSTKGHFKQGSRDQKPRDQFEANWTLNWTLLHIRNKECVILWPLPLTLLSILRQMKNYGSSNISPCKNTIFKKSSKRNQNPSRYYNSITNLKFQHKPKYHVSKILV